MNRDRASLLDIARLDIARAAKLVMQFAEGLDRTSLAANEEKQSAILYQVIVMREAVKRLSEEFRDRLNLSTV